MTNLTKTEQRVIAGMKLAQRAHDTDLAENGQPFEDITVSRTLLQSIDGITIAARACPPPGRAPSQYRIWLALDKLAAKGIVEKTSVNGMGGGFALYKLTEASA